MPYDVLVWYIKACCTCLLTYCTHISAWLPSCALTRKCSITTSFPQIALQSLKSRCAGCRPQIKTKTHLATVFYHSLWFHNYLAKRVYDLIWVANVSPPLSFPPLSVISGGKQIFCTQASYYSIFTMFHLNAKRNVASWTICRFNYTPILVADSHSAFAQDY